MKILIAGSSGLIGSALVDFLELQGHQVFRLVRKTTPHGGILWDPKSKIINSEELEGFDVVINLAGENVAAKRWTKEIKERIIKSRVQTTRLISETLKNLEHPPKVLINASAAGYYGNSGNKIVNESTPGGEGFLAKVAGEWEAATESLLGKDIRIVLLRTGVVLSPKGGALRQMLLPFKLGLGGVIGSGDQYMSWIDIDDALRAIYHSVENEEIHGPVNITAPNPVTHREFVETLGKVLGRWTLLPMPAPLARVVFGEMADEMLLSGTRAIPEKLQKTGFEFKYPDLESSLKHLLSAGN